MTAKNLRHACWLMVVVLTLAAGGLSARAFQLAQTARSAAQIAATSGAALGQVVEDPAGGTSGATQIRFVAPQQASIQWDRGGDGQFLDPVFAPDQVRLGQGQTYNLKVTNIAGHEGLELYATLEVPPAQIHTAFYLQQNAIGVEFTLEDIDQVLSGNAVTKATYLSMDQSSSLANYETLVNTQLGLGVDPVVEAQRRGSILTVIRLEKYRKAEPKAPDADALPGSDGDDTLRNRKIEKPAPQGAKDVLRGGRGEDLLAQAAPAPPAKSAVKAPPEDAGKPAEPPKKEEPPAKPTPADPEAQRILEQAARNLASIDWIRAGIRQRVDLFGKRLDGTGTYLKGPNWKMKLELKIALDDRRPPSSLQQICDGRWLWDHRDILGNRVLTKVDVTAVKDAMERGPARPGQLPTQTVLGLGGLEQLLRGLRGQFDFAMAGTMKVGDRSFLALRGRWQRDVLARMLPNQKKDIEAGKPADLKKLPEYVPDEVLLLLDPKTLFIHRVEYRRTESATEPDKEQEKGDGKSKASRLAGKSLIIMELFDVELGQPVDDLNFLYKSDLQAVDRTEEYLKMLKGDEAKGEGKGAGK